MLKTLKASVERQWYGRPTWLFLLAPLSGMFALVARMRRNRQLKAAQAPPIPVIVIGNISVGGTGKTPIIIALVRALLAQGYRPGVIARGYGAASQVAQGNGPDDGPDSGVVEVTAASDALNVGDEPLLIRNSTQCAVAVSASRVDAAKFLHRHKGCDVILSDDGLQHYRLGRSYECIVVDEHRLFGNGWRLPVGPLREGVKRLAQGQCALVKGAVQYDATGEVAAAKPLPQVITVLQPKAYRFYLKPSVWRNVQTRATKSLAELDLRQACAVAGIGNPSGFFATLAGLGFTGATKSFDDHHPFSQSDFDDCGDNTVLMTEKDAVKCAKFARSNWWALQVNAELPAGFIADCTTHIQQYRAAKPSLKSDTQVN